MRHVSKHACKRRRVGVLGRPADLPQTERAQRSLVALALPAQPAVLCGPNLDRSAISLVWGSTATGSASAGAAASAPLAAETGSTAWIVSPRSSATSSGRRSRFSLTTVALAMLI